HDLPAEHSGGPFGVTLSTRPSQLSSRPLQTSMFGFTEPVHVNTPLVHVNTPALHGGWSYGDMGMSQGVPTLGSPGVQQPGMALCTHMPPGPEQWSAVQVLPSSH